MKDLPHTINLAVHAGTGFYSYLLDMLTFSAMLAKAIEHQPMQSKYEDGDMVFLSKAYNGGGVLAVELHGFLDAIMTGNYPGLLFLRFTAASVKDVRPPAATINKLERRMQFASFALYMDKATSWLRSIEKYSDVRTWPSTVAFARVIRNGIVHNGINISDRNAQKVEWHGVSYGPGENGRQFYPNDLEFGDLLLLLWMTESELLGISRETGTPLEI